MVIFNSFIEKLKSLTADAKELPSLCHIEEGSQNDIIFTKDTAFELGGGTLPCVSTLAVSSDMSFSNKCYLLGKDLGEIKNDMPFAKIVLLEIDDIDGDDEAFNRIRELEQVRYKFFAKHFMTRVSAFSMREQIRVDKKAIKQGLSLADFGNAIIKEYQKFPYVKSVEIIFVTEFDDFNELNEVAQKIKDTTSALNHIFDNVLFDCSSCNLKPICDEVEGMKELHMKNATR